MTGEIKTFHDKQILVELMIIKPALLEILSGILKKSLINITIKYWNEQILLDK
jgi:hypothetical protein